MHIACTRIHQDRKFVCAFCRGDTSCLPMSGVIFEENTFFEEINKEEFLP